MKKKKSKPVADLRYVHAVKVSVLRTDSVIAAIKLLEANGYAVTPARSTSKSVLTGEPLK